MTRIDDIQLYHGDCLEIMPALADGGVDMILTDLPYGCLNRGNKHAQWDIELPLDALWEQWSDEMSMRQASADDYNNDDWDVPHCSAPHIYHAQEWLREKRKIDIELRVWLVGDTREYRPYIMPPKKHDFIAYPPEKSYESALSAGIAAALELIEKGGE